MQKFIIQGPSKLRGEFTPQGAKNAALKMIAAAILTSGKTTLTNVPDLTDISQMIRILESLGYQANRKGDTLEINGAGAHGKDPDPVSIRNMRASVVIIGPLLARFQAVKFPHPGGCIIGARPIDTHLKALTAMNVTVREQDDSYELKTDGLTGTTIVLEEASVTATENIILAATLAKGDTQIRNAACEPEIVDLVALLKKMGAKINGEGTQIINIEGVEKLHGAQHTVLPDRIEIGTIAIAAAVSKGEVEIAPVIPEHLDLFLLKLEQANVRYELVKHPKRTKLVIRKTTAIKPFKIKTQPYPGFPTDLQAPMSILATQASGTSTIYETMFESRLNYTRELIKMGAKIHLENSREAVVHGPTALKGKRITSLDLRSGATLIIASLIAIGESEILHAEHIDRGYANIDQRLNKLGAHIERIG